MRPSSDAGEFGEEPIIHLHPGALWGDEGIIVGTSSALAQLAELIKFALAGADESGDSGCAGLMVTAGDGTKYPIVVICDDDERRWDRAALPYTDADATDTRKDRLVPNVRRGVREVVDQLESTEPKLRSLS